MHHNLYRLAALFLSLNFATPAFAVVVNIPSSVNPAVVADSYSPSIRDEKPITTKSAVVIVKAKRLRHISFTLKDIKITGNHIFSEKILAAYFTPYLHRYVSMEIMEAQVKKINECYFKAGFVISTASIPEQNLEQTGILHIEVHERAIEKVEIVGNVSPALKAILLSYAEKIQQDKPLTQHTIERYTLLANDLPGASVETIVSPSPLDPHLALLTFKVQRRPIRFMAKYGELGSRFIGPQILLLGAQMNGILGAGQVTIRSALSPANPSLRFEQLMTAQPVGPYGDIAYLMLTKNLIRPQAEFKQFKIEGDSHGATLAVMHPLWIKAANRLRLFAVLNYQNSQQTLLNQTNFIDHLRTLELSVKHESWDQLQGSNSLLLSYVQGLPILNGSRTGQPLLSKTNACPTCSIYSFEYLRTQDLYGALALKVGITGQYSAHPLLSGMQLAYGGPGYGRAYDRGELTGDKGIAANAELIYTLDIDKPLMQQMQPFLYADRGSLWNIRPLTNVPPLSQGASIGAGSRFVFNQYLTCSLEMYKPLTRPPMLASRGTRYFAALTMVVE